MPFVWALHCALASGLCAQASAPVHHVDGSFVKEWLVLGPFPSADLGTDFLAEVGGEAEVAPREGDRVVTEAGDSLVWRRYATRQDFVDLQEALGDHDNATAYAYCELQSAVAGEAGIDLQLLNDDDAEALWLNGEPDDLRLRQGANRCLLKLAHDSGRWGFALRLFPPDRAVLAGMVVDAAGEPVSYANLRLGRYGTVVAEWQTDFWGEYEEVNIYPADGPYDLSVTQDALGTWQLGLEVQSGGRLQLTHEVREAVSVSGTLLMLDGRTPHVAVPVQALWVGPEGTEVVATALSGEGGQYRFVNLKPGQYQVRCQVLDGHVYYASGAQVTAKDAEGVILDVDDHTALSGVDFHLAPFKKGAWITYNTLNGLVDNLTFVVNGGPDGILWLGARNGVLRFDGSRFTPIGLQDGLTDIWINAIETTPDGTVWIGSEYGAHRYDGTQGVPIDDLVGIGVLDFEVVSDDVVWIATKQDVYRYDGAKVEQVEALAGIWVHVLYRDSTEVMWLGTDRGVYRYDGRNWYRLSTADGLASDLVTAIVPAADGVMWFGTAGGASRYDPRDGEFDNLTTEDGLVDDFVNDLHVADDGVVWLDTDGGVSRYDGQTCVNYTMADGLADNRVFGVYQDLNHNFWFATERGGVSRYDGETFDNLTSRDGLVDNLIEAFEIEPDGTIWLGTGFAPGSGSGVFRYDGEKFVQFTVADGLGDNTILSIDRCPDGTLWIGTNGGGISRYDGQQFETMNVEAGLSGYNNVETIYCDPDGVVWFGSSSPYVVLSGGGLSRYDGESFVHFPPGEGLSSSIIFAIHRDDDGVMWFGAGSNPSGYPVSHYDGESFAYFNPPGGFPGSGVFSIHGDEDGMLWFGTTGSGIVGYDGQQFIRFTTADGVANDIVLDFHRASDGILWVATNGGVSGYDGETWTILDTRDGLVSNEIRGIFQDAEGLLWFITTQGISRYRRNLTAPVAEIDFVRTDDGRQTALTAIQAVQTDTRVIFGYRAVDFKTIPEKQQYRYRIRELDTDWRKPTRDNTFEWTPQASGTYTFEVQAIDRDLNYSEPASVTIVVTPQYGRIAMVSGLVVLSIGLVLAGGYGLRRRRERDQIREQLVTELGREMQTAHELQMSLMPTEAPQIPGIAVAGHCLPATDVGGDIFQYFAQDDKFALSVADVTGHGMQAAVPVMTFSGILNTEMQYDHALEILLAKLNQTLHQSLQRRTFICFAMGEYYPLTHRFRVSSCGLPYPCHYQAATQTVDELQMDAFPLGIRPNTTYEIIELQLQPDDRVVFFSDGLVEASNSAGDFFGFERILEAIRQGCSEGLSAQSLLQRIFAEVKAFSGEAPQDDDQTLVVLHVGLWDQ